MKAQLHIQAAWEKGRTYLKQPFFTTPFKLMNITEDRNSLELHVMLMSSSPGILDGDAYEIRTEVENNCFLQLHTQAYQRLFTMKGSASQQMDVHIGSNASFVFLPHPSVPHEQSSFISRNNFYLQKNSQLVFGEVLTCGRKLNGELFKFSKYQSITQVFINDALAIKENLLMQPLLIDVKAIGQLEGYTHQANMIWLQEGADIKPIQTSLLQMLEAEENIDYGITAAPANGLIIRLLGNGAEQLYSYLQRMAQILPTTKTLHYAG